MSGAGRLVLIACMSLLSTACGRKGALIYPDMLVPAAPSAVTVQQSGSAVKIRVTLPDKDRAGRPLRDVAGAKISRRAFDGVQKDICRSCQTDYELFRTLHLDRLPSTAQRLGSLLVTVDNDVREGSSYSYRVAAFTADGVDGAPSPAADVRVAAPLASPLVAIEAFPTELKLRFSWQPPTATRLLGFNLYRSASGLSTTFLPLNAEPLKDGEYVDKTPERGVTYRYAVRAVVVQKSGDSAESAASDAVEGILKDDE